METVIKIDPEFQNVLPPLTEEEFLGLERQIITEGCINPLVLWGDVLVDGHNRYNICQKHNIEFSTVQHAFDSRDDVISWIISNQIHQRNLSSFARTELAMRVEQILREKAKNRQRGGKGGVLLPPKLAEAKSDVRDQVSKIAGISHGTFDKVKKIKTYGDPETIEKVRKGEMSINKAFTSLKSQKRSNKDNENQPEDQSLMIEELVSEKSEQKIQPTKRSGNKNASKEYQAECAEIRNLIGEIEEESFMEYTIENLTMQIKANSDAFIRMLSNLIMDHADLCNEHPDAIVMAIEESVTVRIEQIKERLNNGTQL